ncbi:MAG: 50S ribosomal protein L21e [Candidatus Odinarchaeia archaeon]
MVKKSKGYRRGIRQLLRKHPRQRGLAPLGRILYEYSIGEKVAIIIDPSVHKGQPHKRFHGKIGVIQEKRGRAYVVSVRDGKKLKCLTVRPEHIRPHLGG